MSYRSAGDPLTPEQVHERLVSMLDRTYGGNVELMAIKLNIDKYYLKMLLKAQRCPPRWLLDKLGIVRHRHVIVELYDAA
ncbi:hypothetical protein P3T23_004501 [Paraburkholderia sp. GAS448]|uniref:hypothetical protein n=1 Tax=Paraburkholderia sp. GAS448 TaxID=3035136 RepID=UPI003D203D75